MGVNKCMHAYMQITLLAPGNPSLVKCTQRVNNYEVYIAEVRNSL